MNALPTPSPEAAILGLRAMRMIVAADGSPTPGGRRLLEAAQRVFLGVRVDIDTLAPITPEELARTFPAELRESIVRGMVVATLVSGKPTPNASERVRDFACALGVEQPAVQTVELFARGHMLLGALDYHRRSNLRGMLADEIDARGLTGAISSFLGLRGLREDPMIAAPYLSLEKLPAGTLGRALFDHYRHNGFSFPGERGGFPEAGVYHDVTHVLAGYGTDPLGELQIGAFTAGFRKKDPLFVAMLPLLLFCADINVTPIPHERPLELFAQGDNAEKYLRAVQRGMRVRVDLSDGWSFWPFASRPLADVRAELGIA
ncbi:MAG: hypothetical protein KF819_18305 [Labilithrix sp.]|nr:hypothetical protein [Labilithrix sp.]